MKELKLAAAMLLLYAAIMLAIGVYYAEWSGDMSEMPRMFVRVLGVTFVAGGLWRGASWGWWAGIVFSGFFSIFGLFGLDPILASGVLEARPAPTANIYVYAVFTAVLSAAFVCLLSRPARRAVRA